MVAGSRELVEVFSVTSLNDLVDGDDTGGNLEGFVNIPLGDSAAVRLVGWTRSDAGWVDNIRQFVLQIGLNALSNQVLQSI